MDTETYILFWGHTGNNYYKEFSNFYPCTFIDTNNIKYNCTEQYFMIKKAETFEPDNKELIQKILNETNPMQIKKYGRSIKNFDTKLWNTISYKIMYDALLYKFTQNDNLKKILIDTATKHLVEASPYDAKWGAGMNAKEIKKSNYKYSGTNLLGKALEEVRTNLINNVVL